MQGSIQSHTGAKNILIASWRPQVVKQYGSYIKKWNMFNCQQGTSATALSVECVIDFLSDLFDHGLNYSAVNKARIDSEKCPFLLS